MRLAAGIRLLVPAVQIGGEQTRAQISNGGNDRPIDRKVDPPNVALPQVLGVGSDLRETAIRVAANVFAGVGQAPLGALEEHLEGIRLPDRVVELYLEVVGACRKSVGPHWRVDQADPEAVPGLGFELRIAASQRRKQIILDVNPARYAVRRTVRLLGGSRTVPARIKVPVLLETHSWVVKLNDVWRAKNLGVVGAQRQIGGRLPAKAGLPG